MVTLYVCPSLELNPQALKVLERLHGERRGGDVEPAARGVHRVLQPQGLVHPLEDHLPRYPVFLHTFLNSSPRQTN